MTMPEPRRCLLSSTRPLKSLGSSPSIIWPMKAMPPTSSGPADAATAPPLPPSASAFFASASSRSAFFTCSASAATREGASSGVVRSSAAMDLSASSRSDSHKRAASPVNASIRRTPLATAPSLTILNSAISPSACTWVPPHSSTE